MKEQISIIIPTFNRANTLNRAIESVQSQTCENWELIVIDDGSSDATEDLVKTYLHDSRIKYFFQENRGVSVARNVGINLASSNYIVFLDSDDQFYSFLIEELNNINLAAYDLIFWELRKIIDNKPSTWKPVNLGLMYNNLVGTFLAGSVCYKKQVLLNAGNFDSKIKFGENYELGLRISAINNLELKYLAKPMAQQNLTTEKRESNLLEHRLSSILYQYEKHKHNYNNNAKAKSEINYLIGFLFEEANMNSKALERYKLSLESNPLSIKALIKFLYLKLLR